MQHIEIEELTIALITEKFVEDAKRVILEGLLERFGFLVDSYNQDLKDIMNNYIEKGDIFLIGTMNNKVVCTGALTKESQQVGRIERMSVQKEYRGKGFAVQMLIALEKKAIEKGIKRIVLETNSEWNSAIELYKKNGFIFDHKDSRCSHFYKHLQV